MSTASELAVAVVRASVMIYDEGGKRWLPAGQGGQPAESKVQLFQHQRISSFRIVARKGPDHEVVLNCPLYAAMKYNQTTATFHQWRTEQRILHGLNFVTPDDAQSFGQAVLRAVEALNLAAGVGGTVQQQMPSQNGTYDHHHNQQHNGLSSVASAPALMRQQPPSQPGHYQQQQGPQYVPHPPVMGEYCPQPIHQAMHQHRISQEDAQQQFHQNAVYQQQQHANEAFYGVSPALHLQKHQRQPSAGSNASSSGSSGCTSQASNLIYSTVTPTNAMPSPSRPAPPVPPPPPPTPPAPSKASAPNGGGVPPAPPPPPPPAGNGTPASNTMPRQPLNLAQALSTQKLRKVPSAATTGRATTVSDEPTINKDARSASVGCVDTTISASRGTNNAGFGGGGHSDVMSEMAATLARRRLMVESGSATSSGTITNGAEATSSDSPTRANDKGSEVKKPWESRNGSRPSLNETQSSNTDSPKTHRKVPSGSSLSSQEDVGLSLMAGGSGVPGAVAHQSRSLSNGPTSAATPFVTTADTLEQWKQEILNEVRREINKAKAEIIDALKLELNRR